MCACRWCQICWARGQFISSFSLHHTTASHTLTPTCQSLKVMFENYRRTGLRMKFLQKSRCYKHSAGVQLKDPFTRKLHVAPHCRASDFNQTPGREQRTHMQERHRVMLKVSFSHGQTLLGTYAHTESWYRQRLITGKRILETRQAGHRSGESESPKSTAGKRAGRENWWSI